MELPPNHHTLNTFVLVDDATEFIDHLVRVFGASETESVRTPDRDGSLIHAEVVIGDSTIMIADRKPDWPITPAFNQIYVDDIDVILTRATTLGSMIVTPRSPFYGGYDVARLMDPWHNLWWLYAPAAGRHQDVDTRTATTDWHESQPSVVYSTLMEFMRDLRRVVQPYPE